jgi:demethylmenaquinone methyltransferase/2-methoxy-6-polyprenyl-1,4-benzoquinol methylase
VASAPEAYHYLIESIRRFPDQSSYADLIQRVGFTDVTYQNLSLGIACIHAGRKPQSDEGAR